MKRFRFHGDRQSSTPCRDWVTLQRDVMESWRHAVNDEHFSLRLPELSSWALKFEQKLLSVSQMVWKERRGVGAAAQGPSSLKATKGKKKSKAGLHHPIQTLTTSRWNVGVRLSDKESTLVCNKREASMRRKIKKYLRRESRNWTSLWMRPLMKGWSQTPTRQMSLRLFFLWQFKEDSCV